MPNIHNISFPIEKYGLTNKDHTGNPTIFYPIDEPHGMIKVSVAGMMSLQCNDTIVAMKVEWMLMMSTSYLMCTQATVSRTPKSKL